MFKHSIFQALIFAFLAANGSANFNSDVEISWGDGRAKVLEAGNVLQLSLDHYSGSGFQSKAEYLFGRIDMDIKLVPGNSAGTVTTFYLSSQGPLHDEIDFEFLGNASGEPCTLHTNVFSQGKGNREQQFYLWFDPRADFHTYSVVWNPERILFYVDGTPIRVFHNTESLGVPYPKSQSLGVPYPKSQPMRLYSSLWDAENWATRGGLVKTDWSVAPFIASYRNLRVDVCTWSAGKTSCSATKTKWWDQSLDANAAQKLEWVRKTHMIYDYCKDASRFAQGFPPECSVALAP